MILREYENFSVGSNLVIRCIKSTGSSSLGLSVCGTSVRNGYWPIGWLGHGQDISVYVPKFQNFSEPLLNDGELCILPCDLEPGFNIMTYIEVLNDMNSVWSCKFVRKAVLSYSLLFYLPTLREAVEFKLRCG
jgi:hypothetical protein